MSLLSSAINPPARLLDSAYIATQRAVAMGLGVSHAVLRQLERSLGSSTGGQAESRPPTASELHALRARFDRLVRDDLNNVRQGLYPASLLIRRPYADYLRCAPGLALETARSRLRRHRGKYRDLPAHATQDAFPAYYRRNFHWQSDGYFSERSARLYDASVEFLFLGAADTMRRQTLAKVASHLKENGAIKPLVLDLACGTGRFAQILSHTVPNADVTGFDLSPDYIAFARKTASPRTPDFRQGNAEQLPYADNTYDVVTCIFLMHELPRTARRNVVAEAQRILKPGGLLVLQDAAQATDGEDVLFFLNQFDTEFHEPFFRDYLQDNLEDLLRDQGMRVVNARDAYVSRVVSAKKA